MRPFGITPARNSFPPQIQQIIEPARKLLVPRLHAPKFTRAALRPATAADPAAVAISTRKSALSPNRAARETGI